MLQCDLSDLKLILILGPQTPPVTLNLNLFYRSMGKIKLDKKCHKKSLGGQIEDFDKNTVQPKLYTRPPKKKNNQNVDDESMNEQLSKKILSEARLQQQELSEPCIIDKPSNALEAISRKSGDQDDSDELSDNDSVPDHEDYEPVIVDEKEETIFSKFMAPSTQPTRTLADIIMEKIKEKETEIGTHVGAEIEQGFDARVEKLFKSVGEVLSKYRAGKLPKAFKAIPSLGDRWEEALFLTNPDQWSAAAVYQGTRVFASNLKSDQAQTFFNLVLLPRVRDDIAEYKRLNFHLYQALKKALFKPAGYFKGLLLPLLNSGTCSLREAVIIGSVLAKNSVPVLHSSAAMLKIAEMDYSGANSLFLRVLLEKRYALPYRVIDALVAHFCRFSLDKRELPVLFHQSLLTFAQRYKEDISHEQKQHLFILMQNQSHPKITPEIRRELTNSKCRGDDIMVSEPPPIQDLSVD